MKPPRVPAGGGFTLIEVLVALAIVAIGMSAVLTALASSADTVNYLRDKTFAQWVALNKIATIRISGQQPPTGTTNGDTDYAGRSWHWRQAVVATEVPGVVRIDVSVRPAEVKGGDDNGWVTTVSGISGNSVGTPDGGATPNWGTQQQGPPIGPGGIGGGAQQPVTTPPATTAPGTPIVTPPTTPGQPPPGSRQ